MKNPAVFLLLALPATAAPEPPAARFREQTVDAELAIGYGVAIADVDGDGKPDIILADARETRWYRNPSWEKHVLTGSLTKNDHVCIAARDIDGDSKAEIAVGAEWNPGDTKDSGAVFALTAPDDPAKNWQAIAQHREPTVHRMNWVRDGDTAPFLAVLPLHGCGNKDGEGEGIRFLGYQAPVEKSADPVWKNFLIHQGFHMAHNFVPVVWNATDKGESMLVAEKEGVHLITGASESWKAVKLTDHGAGEVQSGKLPDGRRFLATIEPMHGHQVVIYPDGGDGKFPTRVLADETLNQGHALATADFLGTGSSQIAAGWREPSKNTNKTGIRLYIPVEENGSAWKLHATLGDNTMACEDMKAADLNGDGKPEIIASGRASKNLVIFWNETGKAE